MTTDQKMQQLAESATEGPWEAFEDNDGHPYNEWLVSADNGDQQIIDWGNGSTKADAQFIAACRQWVPNALRRLEAVRELHQPYEHKWLGAICNACERAYPCPTVKALDGEL